MRAFTLLGASLILAGCGGVQIAPTPELPRALIEPIAAKVGLVVAEDMRNYTHTETRGGVQWVVQLGAGHQKLVNALLNAGFREVIEFASLDAARAADGLQAIFEPRVEQYSFATARDTGGDYVAATIRYRIGVHAADGQLVDTLTLTGYGNSLAGGMSSSAPIEMASRLAMRDAAAKFLTQFPQQPVAKALIRGEALVAKVGAAGAAALGSQVVDIAAVPIVKSRRRTTGGT